jgi:hypothetical protein
MAITVGVLLKHESVHVQSELMVDTTALYRSVRALFHLLSWQYTPPAL